MHQPLRAGRACLFDGYMIRHIRFKGCPPSIEGVIAAVFKYLFELVFLGDSTTIFGGTGDSALNPCGGIGRCCEAMTSPLQAGAETPGN